MCVIMHVSSKIPSLSFTKYKYIQRMLGIYLDRSCNFSHSLALRESSMHCRTNFYLARCTPWPQCDDVPRETQKLMLRQQLSLLGQLRSLGSIGRLLFIRSFSLRSFVCSLLDCCFTQKTIVSFMVVVVVDFFTIARFPSLD